MRISRHNAIATYAAEMGGTDLDLDRDLELAGIEEMVRTGKEAQ